MYRFFDPVIRPLLDAAKPSVVAEVGSDRGLSTELLATWCQENGALLHSIDPLPKYDVDEWSARWPGVIRFHRDLSLNALLDIGSADVVCIDGDHNWYTLFHELQILGRLAADTDQPFPLTVMHDVGWPYGRRDLYYDPNTIPGAFRHPHRKAGITPGARALVNRGFNDHLENAIHEGTPRNGVLTAAEDYVAQHDGDLTLHVIPGLHGLGIIIDAAAEEAVSDAVARVLDAPGLRRVLQAVEDDRIARLEAERRAQQDLTRERGRVERIRAEVIKQVEKQRQLSAKVEGLRKNGDELRRKLDQARENEKAAGQRLREARTRNETLKVRAARAEGQLKQERDTLTQRDQELASLGKQLEAQTKQLENQAALSKQVRDLKRDLTRLRNRRSVRFVLKIAGVASPIFRLRRGQLFGGRSRRRSGDKPSAPTASSKEGSPALSLVAPEATTADLFTDADTGLFFNLMRELVDQGVTNEFAEAWRASESFDTTSRSVLDEGPLVSIIMPTYNRAHLIGDAVASVLEQSYRNWELLVCDDASEDDTEPVIQNFADPRIVYRRLPKGGAARARNAGLGEAGGQLIAYLDSDNLWHPRFLETMVAVLTENPGRYAAYCKYVDIVASPEGLRLKRSDPRWFDRGWLIDDDFTGENSLLRREFDYDRLSVKNFIDLSSLVHRRALYDHLGGLDERLVRQQDWDLILKYSFLRDPLYIDRFLMLYRRSDDWNQITKVHKDDPTSSAIIESTVVDYYRRGLPTTRRDDLPSLSVLSWDISRNHFSKAYNIAEAMADRGRVQLLGFRFFGERIFPPYTNVEPSFDTCYLSGGDFPGWRGDFAKAVTAASGEVLYAVKPRLPSLGVALLANYHFGKPIILEINDLESVVTNPRSGQDALTFGLADVDPGDPGLLNPYGPLWTGIMERLASQIPLRVTHNSVLDEHFGGGAFFLRNPKDERHFDPANFNREEVRRGLGFTPEQRVLLFGGMVRRHKGVFELADLLEHADPSYRLLVVGSRDTPDQAILESRAGDRVKVIDHVDRNEMAAINLASDAVVLWLDPDIPASRYQMPFKLTDALAMKVPVIANDIGDLGELGREGYLRLVPFGQADELMAALDDLFTNRRSTRAMVEAGRRLYLRQFSYAAVRRNVEMILAQAATKRGTLPVAEEFAEFFAEFNARLPARSSVTTETRSLT